MTQRQPDKLWDSFDPAKYLEHNYQQAVLPEDQAIMRRLHERMTELVVPRSLGHIANIGHGGAFHADAIIQDFAADSGQIDLIEYSFSNLAAISQTIENGMQGNRGMWQKFEDFAADLSPSYRGGLTRAFSLSSVQLGSIYALSPDMYDAGFTFYCPESITDRQADYEQAVNTFVRSVKRGGPVVMAFMRNSEGYDTPGRLFPAYPVGCDDVEALLEPLTTDLEVMPIDAPRGARPIDGPQYEGMGLATGIRL